jgi:hypothetical protein
MVAEAGKKAQASIIPIWVIIRFWDTVALSRSRECTENEGPRHIFACSTFSLERGLAMGLKQAELAERLERS